MRCNIFDPINLKPISDKTTRVKEDKEGKEGKVLVQLNGTRNVYSILKNLVLFLRFKHMDVCPTWINTNVSLNPFFSLLSFCLTSPFVFFFFKNKKKPNK